MINSMKLEIEAALRHNLETSLDEAIALFEFDRRENALVYIRKLPGAVQKIEIAIEFHPADRPDSVAAIYPWLSVSIDAVEMLVFEMTGGHDALLVGPSGTTVRQPIEFTSAKEASGRWFIYQPDSIARIVAELRSFLELWTVPFLDLYSTPAGICRAYDQGDERVTNQSSQKIRVVAAMMLCGRTADALGVMERWFGRPGSRKRYQRVFEYLESRS